MYEDSITPNHSSMELFIYSEDMSSASTKTKQIREPMLAHMKKVASEESVLALAAVVATTLLMMLPPGGGAASPAATTATGLGSNNNRCTRRCGNISVPYPFGFEPGCYHAAGFNLTCIRSFQQPLLFLGNGYSVQVLNISVEDSTVHIYSPDVQFQYDGVSVRVAA